MSDYVLVPREPTEEMVEAGGNCPQMQTITGVMSLHQARGYKIDGLGGTYNTCALAEAYRAMLAAAPAARQPTEEIVERLAPMLAEYECDWSGIYELADKIIALLAPHFRNEGMREVIGIIEDEATITGNALNALIRQMIADPTVRASKEPEA